MSMKVSVIIVNYNTFALTCASISSVLEMTRGVEAEVILVDNASSECRPEKFLEVFPAITLVPSATNLGFAGGNNLGIKRATGEYILLLNSDAAVLNDAVSMCATFLNDHADVAVVSGRLEYPDGRVQHCCQRFPAIGPKLFELLRLQKFTPRRWSEQVLLGSFFDHERMIYPDWVWGTCFMFPRRLLSVFPTGLLPADFFMYGEDMQWCREFRLHGYAIAYLPEARVLHHLGQSKAPRNTMMEANMAVFMHRYYQPWQRWMIRRLDQWLGIAVPPVAP